MLYVNASDARYAPRTSGRDHPSTADVYKIKDTLQRTFRTQIQPVSLGGQYSIMFLMQTRGRRKLIKVSSIHDGKREARVLQHLQRLRPIHRSCGIFDAKQFVPRLYTAGRVGSMYYLVLEYIEGVTFHEFLRHPRSPVMVARVRQQMAVAQRALMAAGVYHGDLHENNVMVTPQGTIRVLDFGFATIVPALQRHACDGAHRIPQAIVDHMRKKQYQYGRLRFHDNRETYTSHLRRLNGRLRNHAQRMRVHSPRRPIGPTGGRSPQRLQGIHARPMAVRIHTRGSHTVSPFATGG